MNERLGGAAETWDEPEFTIDTKVREFAEHLGCDPRVAQEAYDRMKVDWSLDGEIGRDLREELKGLEAVERSINRANYFMRLVPSLILRFLTIRVDQFSREDQANYCFIIIFFSKKSFD